MGYGGPEDPDLSSVDWRMNGVALVQTGWPRNQEHQLLEDKEAGHHSSTTGEIHPFSTFLFYSMEWIMATAIRVIYSQSTIPMLLSSSPHLQTHQEIMFS